MGFQCETNETHSTDPTRKHLPGEILEEIVSSPGILIPFCKNFNRKHQIIYKYLISPGWARLRIRYRKISLKRLTQGLLFKCILKDQESKSWVFFEGPRRFWGPQKSEKFNFLKRTNKSVDHKFKSFAINWPQISIQNLKFA